MFGAWSMSDGLNGPDRTGFSANSNGLAEVWKAFLIGFKSIEYLTYIPMRIVFDTWK